MITQTQTAKTRQTDLNHIRAKVFAYPSGKADERYFKMAIAGWLTNFNPNRPTFNQALFNMVHVRNNGGYTLKYCYFNNNCQRVFLHRDFEKWANMIKPQIESTLIKINEL